jgi:hypothetical protein
LLLCQRIFEKLEPIDQFVVPPEKVVVASRSRPSYAKAVVLALTSVRLARW